MGSKRFGCGAVVWEGSIYAMGGHDGSNVLRSVERFDGSRWSEAPSMQIRRFGCAAAVFLGSLYAVRGRDGSLRLSSVEKFDGSQWTAMTGMVNKRYGCATVVWEGCLYAIGGHDGRYNIDLVELSGSCRLSLRSDYHGPAQCHVPAQPTSMHVFHGVRLPRLRILGTPQALPKKNAQYSTTTSLRQC